MEKDSRSVSQQILNAAYRCILKNGYAQSSMRDIAEDAGVVLSQVNYYYKNKEGLFTEVIRELYRSMVSEMELRLQHGGTPKERLSALVSYFKGMMHDNTERLRLLFDLASMSLWNPGFKALLNGFFDDMSGLVKTYVLDDTVQPPSPLQISTEARARSIVGTMFGTAMQYMINPADSSLIDSLSCIESI